MKENIIYKMPESEVQGKRKEFAELCIELDKRNQLLIDIKDSLNLDVEIDMLKAHLNDILGAFKPEMKIGVKTIKEEYKKLLSLIDSGYNEKVADVEYVKDFSTRKVSCVDLETGQVYWEKPMDASDMQIGMFDNIKNIKNAK